MSTEQQRNPIAALAEDMGRPSKMLDATLPEVENYIKEIRKTADHYGISKVNKMPLRELQSEITRRQALAEQK